MEMVATIIVCANIAGLGWVLDDLVKINHRIESTAGPNPLVYGLANFLFLGRIVALGRLPLDVSVNGVSVAPTIRAPAECVRSMI
jgi:hypothetical protein